MPNVIVGTRCCEYSYAVPRNIPPPKLRLCRPFCQLTVSSMFRLGVPRQLGEFDVNGSVRSVPMFGSPIA